MVLVSFIKPLVVDCSFSSATEQNIRVLFSLFFTFSHLPLSLSLYIPLSSSISLFLPPLLSSSIGPASWSHYLNQKLPNLNITCQNETTSQSKLSKSFLLLLGSKVLLWLLMLWVFWFISLLWIVIRNYSLFVRNYSLINGLKL